MLWQRRRYRDEQRLSAALAGCRGKIAKGLRRELCRLDALALAGLLAGLWPRLEEATREQLAALAEEEGFIDAWLRALEQGKAGEKAAAATILGEMEIKRALGPLLAALGDRDEGVQMAATAALTRLRDRRCLEPLLAALAEPRRWPPARVAEVLLALGTASIPPLLDLLARGPEDISLRVINILGLFEDGRVLPALEHCLENGTAAVRRAAAMALGETGCGQAAESLKKALADPVAAVRAAAARSLGRLKCREAGDLLKGCLADATWEVRVAAGAALAELGAAREEQAMGGEHQDGSAGRRYRPDQKETPLRQRPVGDITGRHGFSPALPGMRPFNPYSSPESGKEH
ncbi:Armadillo-type fold [Moorella glycerini]|uniref:PBS lyase HEAT-like repeat protein n=1 Tax=Neomoorella stamsii TaxID=1266720 RepID=A0A9X7J5P9_9FIRM|nr:PBS lyase HEAT-like repeat protein [Moorella stamsii]CEP68940.1 Armadillo-type fold [Moorella glycerini]